MRSAAASQHVACRRKGMKAFSASTALHFIRRARFGRQALNDSRCGGAMHDTATKAVRCHCLARHARPHRIYCITRIRRPAFGPGCMLYQYVLRNYDDRTRAVSNVPAMCSESVTPIASERTFDRVCEQKRRRSRLDICTYGRVMYVCTPFIAMLCTTLCKTLERSQTPP